MQKMTFFPFQLGMGYGVRKMTARVWWVFLLFRSTFPDPSPSRYRSFCGSKWPKIIKIFCFWVWKMGCLIEWAHGGGHIWYSVIFGFVFLGRIGPIGREVLVSLITSHSKYCLLPKGEKNWAPAPQMSRLRVMDQFFRPPGPSCHSHSDLKKWGAI